MRFGIIYYGAQPRDRDLDQLAQALRQMGHECVIAARARQKGAPVREFNGTPVIELPSEPSRLSHLRSIPLPFNFFWTRWIRRLAKEQHWHAIFVRETPLARHGLAAGRKLGIPVFLDMRENLPIMYATGQKKKWTRRFLRPTGLVKRYETKVCPNFNHVFTVSDELGQWVEETYGVNPANISTLGNYPSSAFLKGLEQAKENKKKIPENSGTKSNIRLIHTGNINWIRGLQDILDALKILVSENVPVEFRIIGDGPFLGTLKQKVQHLGLKDHVQFIPMLSPGDVPTAVLEGDIGVCAYLLNPYTHQTMPGKLFEFMAAGLPVITSARKPVVRIVKKEKCGVIYQSREPGHIADAIRCMINNPEETMEMGKRARQAILARYNQDSNVKVLATVFAKYWQ